MRKIGPSDELETTLSQLVFSRISVASGGDHILARFSNSTIDAIVEDGSLDKGIVEGIMCFLREKKAKGQHKVDYSIDQRFEFFEQLKRASQEIGKVFDHSLCGEYFDRLPALRQVGLEIIDVLESEDADD